MSGAPDAGAGVTAGDPLGPHRRTVLVTGATGRIGFPIARGLARRHRVVGVARCSHPGDEARLREAGIEPLVADVASLDPTAIEGVTHVFHAAAHLGAPARRDWQRTMEVNAVVTGRLMAACRGVEGFVLCSSGSVYEYQGQRPLREDDPPGVHLGVYSLSKIAAESVARFVATEHRLPTTVLRVFSTYGPLGGAPVDRLRRMLAGKEVVLHPDRPNRYTPIHEDDYVELGIRALTTGQVPPTVVNFAGSETVSVEEYCTHVADLVGVEPRFRVDPAAPWPLWADTGRMHEVLGRTSVPWREGMRRVAETLVGRPLPSPPGAAVPSA